MEKLEILPYNKKFVEIFKREKEKISEVLNNCEIYHIGSTAVPGLGGKGIIDIMIGIGSWKETKDVIEKLESIGFKHIHPKEQGRIFLSRIGATKYGDVHIHVVVEGSKPYKEMLFFRSYLRTNKKEVERYFNLKLKWLEKAKGNRAKYTKAKEDYMRNISRRVNGDKEA